MNIIWLTLESILPANSGGRIGIFRRLEQLSKNNNIFLFYTMDSKEDEIYISELKKYCKEVHGYIREKKSFGTIIKSLSSPYPVASRYNKKMINGMRRCIDDNKIDLINIDSPHMCLNLFELKFDIPVVLNQHNIEWKVYRNISNSSKNMFKKMVYYVESLRFKQFENKLYKRIKFDLITFVSEEDMEFFSNANKGNNKLALVPVGAIDYNKNYDWLKKKDEYNIIFVGKMSYEPNVEAVKWFSERIFPKIINELPTTHFFIVGKDPVDEVKQLNRVNNNIHITGGVESVEPYYDTADLVVIPLLHGGGVKIKLLEAMGYQVPMVSSPTGIQGTEFSDNDLLIAGSVDEFANNCLKFLMKKSDYKIMYENLFEKFRKNYTWNAVGRLYDQLLADNVLKK